MSVDELPTDLHARFTRHYQEPLRPLGLLRAAVIAYRSRIGASYLRDTALALRLSEVLFFLLRATSGMDEHSRRVVQAATLWFVDRQAMDLAALLTPAGQEDALLVANHACRLLGRQDLIVDPMTDQRLVG